MEAMTRKLFKNGYFDDKDVKDRELSDWSGEWQSVYPFLQDGTLDQVFEYKSLLNRIKQHKSTKNTILRVIKQMFLKLPLMGKR